MDQERSQYCCARHVDQDTGNGEALKKNQNGRKNLLVSSYVTDSGGRNEGLWSPKIPTKKRSSRVVMYKKKTVSPMKLFHKQLLEMWKIYGNPNGSSSEVLLLYCNVHNFIPSDEIGLGGVLLRPYVTFAE